LLEDVGFTNRYRPRTREQLDDEVDVALDLE
jgi:hypothetical protein